MIYDCKVTIDGTDYVNVAASVNVKRRENNYDVATLTFPDKDNLYYQAFSKFDTAAVYFKTRAQTSYAQVFGGHIRQINPSLSSSSGILTVNCKGYGAALEDTHCNRDYGAESSNPTLNEADEILTDLVDNFVEKSFNGAATGHTLATTRVSDYCATSIKYINNPYRANIEVVDTVASLTSAIGAGSTAGAHWIVVPDAVLTSMFLWGKIGDHTAGSNSPEDQWPDWWNTNQAGSTLTQGEHFTDYVVLDKAEEYANKVVVVTDFRRPAYDIWSEGGFDAGYWAKDGVTVQDYTPGAVPVVVGSECLDIENAFAYTPADSAAGWDITAWGSPRNPPRLNFYMYKNNLVNANCMIILSTTGSIGDLGDVTDYFYCYLSTLDDPNNEWVYKSIPIGPYWAGTDEKRQDRWEPSTVNADWANINLLGFYVVDNGVDPGYCLIDDLHFSGKIARSAYNSDEITAAGQEIQKVFIARNAMDDSCVESDDTGFAARIAYAELLRRVTPPKTIKFTIPADATCTNALMMAGQKIHVHACRKQDGTFLSSSWANGGDMRTLEVEHNWVLPGGFTTTVTASNDLLNSHVINSTDQYAMWQENMFLNSAEAKNIRAAAEVDLLIPLLEKDYAPP